MANIDNDGVPLCKNYEKLTWKSRKPGFLIFRYQAATCNRNTHRQPGAMWMMRMPKMVRQFLDLVSKFRQNS
eukprot:10665070-Karenia_brevis.AAC.1